jgi:hypothetical protein
MFPAIQGGPASLNAQICLNIAGAAYRAPPGDVILSHFVWADPYTGTVANTRTQSYQILAFLPNAFGNWNTIYCQNGLRYLREGYGCVPLVRGDRWARFLSGAQPGNPVYASLVDGSCIAGYALNAELTQFTCITGCCPGGLAAISTWATFSP